MRTTRKLTLTLVAAVLAVGTAAPAYAGGHGEAGHGGHHRSGPPNRVARYVALGDSYTAAPEVPTTSPAGGCYRSDHNYPSLVAAALHPRMVADVSCSGAQTKDMTQSQMSGVAPQFDALSKDTDLVTVSIGGNDFSVFGTLVGYCPTLRASDPTGDPCRQAFTNADGSNALFQDIAQTRQRDIAVVREIRQRAPHARIVVVGYPQIVPSHGTCPSLLPLADGDYSFGVQINRRLTDAMRDAARINHATYVDVWRASQGHSICSAHPWINGQYDDPTAAQPFHPFAVEQAAVAKLVVRAVAPRRPCRHR